MEKKHEKKVGAFFSRIAPKIIGAELTGIEMGDGEVILIFSNGKRLTIYYLEYEDVGVSMDDEEVELN